MGVRPCRRSPALATGNENLSYAYSSLPAPGFAAAEPPLSAPVAVTAPLTAEDAGKRTATQAGLADTAEAPAAPAAKQAKDNDAAPLASKPKDVVEVEAPRANAA